MNSFLIVSEKEWHQKLAEELAIHGGNWSICDSQKDFNLDTLKEQNPDKIFIPHWSHIIPEEIYSNFECIVFHMTDLPYGRGGSPLQNLISRGHTNTKVSALKVKQGIDSGPIYLKHDLSLEGSASEIFNRCTDVIARMILEIVNTNPSPQPQTGEPVIFKRRKPEDGNLKSAKDINQVYDFIRMLDAPGYPKAFIETEKYIVEFSEAQFINGELTAKSILKPK